MAVPVLLASADGGEAYHEVVNRCRGRLAELRKNIQACVDDLAIDQTEAGRHLWRYWTRDRVG